MVNLQKLSIATLVLLMVTMGVATFYEKWHGTAPALSVFYHSYWFIGLWCLTVVLSLTGLLKATVSKSVFLLHVSLVAILLGALVSHTSSKDGILALRKEVPKESFSQKQGNMFEECTLPFHIRLDSFKVETYPGTTTAADYISYLSVWEKGQSRRFVVSMNHTMSYQGFRFCQMSFDDDRQGSVLSVSYDKWGVAISFTGYALLALSMFGVLFARNNGFRTLLRHPLLKASAVALCIGFSFSASAQTQTAKSKTLSPEMAAKFERMWVLYNNRITPLQTVASDFTVKITGHRSYRSYSSTQFLAAWLFFPMDWYDEPVFTIQPELQKLLGVTTNHVSYRQFFTPDGKYKLAQWVRSTSVSISNPLVKAISQAQEKVNLVYMLQNGSLIRPFPVQTAQGTEWLGMGAKIPEGTDNGDSLFIRRVFSLYIQCVRANQADSANLMLARLAGYQRAKSNNQLPSVSHKNLEIAYNKVQPFSKLFMLSLSLGLIAIGWVVLSLLHPLSEKGLKYFLNTSLLAVSFLMTAALGWRTYIGGHIPLGNGYEIMLCTAWAVLLIGVLFRKASVFIPAFSLFLAGIVTLTASLGLNNPQITPLVPVLNSYWLNLHVSCMMMAYAFAGFMAIMGLVVLILYASVSRNRLAQLSAQIERLTLLSRIMLYPCVFLMGAGVFLGAIWANISWGRYWGWDPKETWALISFLTYAILFHTKTFKNLARPLAYHTLAFMSLSVILMTFFGVNYFMGGMHSYAGGETTGGMRGTIVVGVVALLVTFMAWRRKGFHIRLV